MGGVLRGMRDLKAVELNQGNPQVVQQILSRQLCRNVVWVCLYLVFFVLALQQQAVNDHHAGGRLLYQVVGGALIVFLALDVVTLFWLKQSGSLVAAAGCLGSQLVTVAIYVVREAIVIATAMTAASGSGKGSSMVVPSVLLCLLVVGSKAMTAAVVYRVFSYIHGGALQLVAGQARTVPLVAVEPVV
eukprot:SRR837773.2261.p1 GENE.SRR837773.2261~~SRR837773.2261.p1  ORF type:complete len:195 (-),score=65.54 SRR837773.2261:56-619(-)